MTATRAPGATAQRHPLQRALAVGMDQADVLQRQRGFGGQRRGPPT